MATFSAKILALCAAVSPLSCSKREAFDSPRIGNEVLGHKKTREEDPLYPHAWHLNNTGQKAFSQRSGTPRVDINVVGVWRMGITGKGVRIALSDSGLDVNHEEFRGQLLDGEHRNYYGLSSPWMGDPSPTGDDGDHGTGVAGLIVMAAHNGKGGRGVAYGAKMAGLAGGYKNGGAALLDQAQGNFDIFNYSWGWNSCEFRNYVNYAAQLKNGVEKLRQDKGAIYVKAAGNDYTDFRTLCDAGASEEERYVGNASLSFDHTFPWMVVVGSVNADGVKAAYSNPGSALWVVAPGGEKVTTIGSGIREPSMITTDVSGCDRGYHAIKSPRTQFGGNGKRVDPGCHYTSMISGTSMATSVTTGVVALLLEANPGLTWRDVKHILATTSRKVDSKRTEISHPLGMDREGHTYQQTWVTNAAGHSFHNWYGFGMIDATAAVEAAVEHTSGLDTFLESGWTTPPSTLNLPIPDDSVAGVAHTLKVAENYVIETVRIKVTLEHPFVGELGVELTSPSGTVSILMPINSQIVADTMEDTPLSSNAFYGEKSGGSWRLKIIDPNPTKTGTLKSWGIKFYGH